MSRSVAHLTVATAVTLLLILLWQVPGDWNWSGVWEYRQKFFRLDRYS